MKFSRPRSRSEEVFINLTPLIDVVFLLLIFFMVSTTFATIRYGIKVELPKTTTPQEKVEENIVISVTKDNHIYLGKRWIKSEKELTSLLKKEIKEKGGLVVINADKNVKHGQVVKVMELAEKAGATKLGILTFPERKK
ncbi:biopolymer transporter ExbD [Candidatus Aerophobetes bacterium]|uniref:Biopolymer transporter ExbD n=1 Tax=Aerophobetes bacterium TaxID=2030807 RepID=A0A662DCX9_UNCAE|nr:MAG: biopolymer transporter ExbD [Candidatus Aerophobetes bacterium]